MCFDTVGHEDSSSTRLEMLVGVGKRGVGKRTCDDEEKHVSEEGGRNIQKGMGASEKGKHADVGAKQGVDGAK